jgi:hypothetical protein
LLISAGLNSINLPVNQFVGNSESLEDENFADVEEKFLAPWILRILKMFFLIENVCKQAQQL